MAPGSEKKKSGLRVGKWTPEEEAYVHCLIEEFRLGTLPLSKGTTLRFFLSKMLNCHPKRISKKFERSSYNGKHKYEAGLVPMSLDELTSRRTRLQEFENRYLNAIKREEEEQQQDADAEDGSLISNKSADAVHSQDNIKKAVSEKKQTASPTRTSVATSSYRDEIQRRMDLANESTRIGTCNSAPAMRNVSLINSNAGNVSPSTSSFLSQLLIQNNGGNQNASAPAPGNTLSLGVLDLPEARTQEDRQEGFVPNPMSHLILRQRQPHPGAGLLSNSSEAMLLNNSRLGNVPSPTNLSRTTTAALFNHGGLPPNGGSTGSQMPHSLDALTSMRLMAALAREDQQRLEAAQRLNRDLDVLSVFERLQPGSRRELSDSLKLGSAHNQQLQQPFEQQQQQQQQQQLGGASKRPRYF